MSMSLNQVILVGRVGKDPESKFTPNGTQIATFSLVTSEWNSKEKKEIPTWHNIKCIGQSADIAKRLIGKGSVVTLTGKITVSNWDDAAGNKKSKTEILVNTLSIDKPKTSENSGNESSGDADGGASDETSGGEDDLPF